MSGEAVKPVKGAPLASPGLLSIKYSITVILPGAGGAVGYDCCACKKRCRMLIVMVVNTFFIVNDYQETEHNRVRVAECASAMGSLPKTG